MKKHCIRFITLLLMAGLSGCQSSQKKEQAAWERAVADTQGLMDEMSKSLPQAEVQVGGNTKTESSLSDLDGTYYAANDKSDSMNITNGKLNINGVTLPIIEWNGIAGKADNNYRNYEFIKDGDSLLVSIYDGTAEYVKEGGKSILERSMVELDLPLVVTERTFDDTYHIASDGTLYKRVRNRSKYDNNMIDTGVRSFCATHNTIFYIKEDNTLWGRGSNSRGILGDGTGVDRDYSVKILENVADVGWLNALNDFPYALRTDKSFWSWGWDRGNVFEPVKIVDGVTKFTYANGLTILKDSGLIYYSPSWPTWYVVNEYRTEYDGSFHGQLLTGGNNYPKIQITDWSNNFWLANDGILLDKNGLRQICDSDVVDVFDTGHFLKSDGGLWGYGENSQGRLGDGTKVPRTSEPVKIADNVKNVIRQSNSAEWAYLTSTGQVFKWDSNNPTPKAAFNSVYDFIMGWQAYIIYNNGNVHRVSDRELVAENVKLPRTINFSDPSGFLVISETPKPLQITANKDDPRKLYFYDTYNQLGDKPYIMWSNLNWVGWHDVEQPLNKESDGWYSFELASENLNDAYTMIIVYNHLPDDDPNCIQWVIWRNGQDGGGINNEFGGKYFIADNTVHVNTNDEWYKGTQRNASQFLTKEEANTALGKLVRISIHTQNKAIPVNEGG